MPPVQNRKSPRAQAATEYIVILSVVLILGSIILGLSGFFPSFSYSSQVGGSIKYWQSAASPIAIIDTTQSSTSFEAILENKAAADLRITNFTLFHGQTEYQNISILELAPGEKKGISLSTYSCPGGQTAEYEVQIEYDTHFVSSLIQKGAKPLFVQCAN